MKRTPMRNMKSAPLKPTIPPSARVPDGIGGSGMWDSLQNLVTGLGTSKDKVVGTQFIFTLINQQQLEAAFRSDWIARKVVSIPAQDATREWRYWDVDAKERKALEDNEKKMQVQQKVKAALIKARLYGGAALLLGVNQGQLDKELDVAKVGKDALEFIHVVSRWELSAGPIVWDLDSPLYGLPEYYMRAGGASAQQIHPSRVIRFLGNEIPDIRSSNGWGDSILQSVNDAIIAAGMTCANGAQLMNEMKMDVIRIPGFTDSMSNAAYASRLTERFGLANTAKSLYNLLLLDKEEEWQRITAQLTGLDDVLKMYLLIASAAADIPATRMLAQSPAGLSATGESDIRNYYDHVKSEQSTTLQPSMSVLDEVFIRSTLGVTNVDDIVYRWNPLWQLDEQTKSTIITQKATAFKVDVDTALIPSDILRDARLNQLIEDGVYPGLEQILEEYGPLDPIDGTIDPTTGAEIPPPPDPNASIDPNDPNAKPNPFKSTPTITADMAKRVRRANMRNKRYRNVDGVLRTLYVYRPVINPRDILQWAKGLDIPNLEASNELHCTIMYSRTPVDWSKTGDDAWGQDENGNLTVKPGGMRALQLFGNALVLCFNSSNLSWRHCSIKDNTGAQWDFAEYQPHITLAYLDQEFLFDFDERTLAQMGGYAGAIEFGPEVFAEASNPYVRDADGNPYWDYNENHDPHSGEFSSGEGSSGVKSGGAKAAIKNLMIKQGAKNAVRKGANKIAVNKHALANGAVQGMLYHVIGIDYGPDIERAIGHEIEHFAHNAKIGLAMAKSALKDAVTALKAWHKEFIHALDARMSDAAEDNNAAIQKAFDDLLKAIEAYEVPAGDE